jgi:uncharacterized protein (TIGR04222 family)
MADLAADTADHDAVALLERIEAFGFNPPDEPLAFESRLADDQGWTLGYALAVAEEYRRFLVLTQWAGQPMSPSPDVDEAWHLHLTRTAHYEAFCAALFGRFLHHEPARAGEGAKHRDMHAATLDAYRRAFGARPPSPIWPRPGDSAEPPGAPAPVWPVPRGLRPGPRLGLCVLSIALVAGVMLRSLGLLAPLQAIGPFVFLAAALAATAALGWVGLRAAAPSERSAARDRLEPYEAAWFSGGAQRMAMTAIVALTERGVLLPPGKPPERGAQPLIPVNRTVEPRCAHPAEAACLAAATDAGLRFTDACIAMQPLAAQAERRLVAAGVASDVAALPLQRARALFGMLLLLTVEIERIVHSLGTRQRIGFLVLLTIVGMVLALALARRVRRANPRSERALRPLRLAAGLHGKTPRAGQALAFGVALIGGSALAEDLRFDGLQQQVNAAALAMAARRANGGTGGGCSSASSCGSSCSSGDGGGSAGGGSCGSSCGSGCGGGGD